MSFIPYFILLKCLPSNNICRDKAVCCIYQAMKAYSAERGHHLLRGTVQHDCRASAAAYMVLVPRVAYKMLCFTASSGKRAVGVSQSPPQKKRIIS